ncbi:MAG: 2-amino-4-hydroxy-6-hydroxymethyldihydropteridine diphosphokinase [Caldilineaceae bacterium]|nr:2-amino-4-hydroxy-6-hydroxymethyldihydropteridine diphosphokinase [Caldilineaceae bacterium]
MNRSRQHRALILLGSNIDRERNIPLALAKLAAHPALALVAASSVYESPAVGGSGPQPVFSNSAALLETGQDATELRRILREIEAEMGRVRSIDKYAPRPIDLDIILYNDFVGTVAGSPLPDPDLLRFPHIAVPCAEIAPGWVHPQTKETLAAISQKMENTAWLLKQPSNT